MLINEKVYKRIQEKKKILEKMRPLDKFSLEKIKEEFLVEYIYNSTSIEGNTLSLNETKLILEEGITIGGKTLREHLDVTNQKQALGWIEGFIKEKKVLKEADILTLHHITLKGISEHWAGRYKSSENRVIGSRLKTTPSYKVQSEMGNLIYKINFNPEKYSPIELAAFTHHEIAKIHPFIDGNGRVARLVCNLILMKEAYLPVIIRNKDRKKYFACLEKAHFGDLKIFIDFIARMEEESLIRYLSALVKTTPENELVPLKFLTKETSYSQEYLSLLARRGLLSATKMQGVWYSSKENLKKYLEKE